MTLWHSLGFWRTIGLAATTTSALLVFYIAAAPGPAPRTEPPTHIAVLSDEAARPVLLANFNDSTDRLAVHPLQQAVLGPDTELELWLLPPEGGTPHSLGILAQDGTTRTLNGDEAMLLANGELAASIEPSGGSPTGLPTGPVLYQGKVVPAP